MKATELLQQQRRAFRSWQNAQTYEVGCKAWESLKSIMNTRADDEAISDPDGQFMATRHSKDEAA